MCVRCNKDLNPYFKRPVATGLGATEILIGCFSIGFGLWGLILTTSFFYIFFPVWCGALALIGGSVAAATGARPANTMINATLAMSVVSLLAGLCQVAFSTLSFLDIQTVQNTALYCEDQTNYTLSCNNDTVYLCSRWVNGLVCTSEADVNTGFAVAIACLAAGGIQFAIALAAAIICCTCCMKTNTSNKIFPLSKSAANGSGFLERRVMVSKTIQADLRPSTIRARSTSIQTDGRYGGPHSAASVKHVNVTTMTTNPYREDTSLVQTQAPPAPQQQPQQPLPIYILPLGGQNHYPQPYPTYYNPPPLGAPAPTNRDWVRPEVRHDTPHKALPLPRPVAVPGRYEAPTQRAPSSPGRKESGTEKHQGDDDIVRVGDKLIHIRQS